MLDAEEMRKIKRQLTGVLRDAAFENAAIPKRRNAQVLAVIAVHEVKKYDGDMILTSPSMPPTVILTPNREYKVVVGTLFLKDVLMQLFDVWG